jgi:hypothetical protein
LDEAYLEINGLWMRNLDVRIGQAAHRMGPPATSYNPTDNLIPRTTCTTPLQFGRKARLAAVRATYTPGRSRYGVVCRCSSGPAAADRHPAIFEAMFETMADVFAIDTGDAALDVIFKGMYDRRDQRARASATSTCTASCRRGRQERQRGERCPGRWFGRPVRELRVGARRFSACTSASR